MSKLGDETLVRRFWQYVRPRRVYTEEDIGKIIHRSKYPGLQVFASNPCGFLRQKSTAIYKMQITT